jgi:CubicO group peptidase (beta-lactamase class C family)
MDARYAGAEDAIRRGMPHYQESLTPDELINKFYSEKLQRPPGEAFNYNNADYIILGRIAEEISGQPFEVILQDRILSRLGMRDTGLLRQRDIVSRLAPTYFSVDGSKPLISELPTYIENWFAAGAMYSTAADLMRFADALYGGHLLKPKSLERMLEPGLDGYGFGVWIGYPTFGGKPYRNVNRPGSIMGATGSFYHFNGVGFSRTINIVILSNTNLTDLDAFSWHIGQTLLN